MNPHRQESTSPQDTVAVNGTRIKQLRKAKKLTQLYISTVLEVAVDTVSRWENNRSPNMKLENAEKLADILEVSIEEISKSPPAVEPEETAEESGESPSIQGGNWIKWLLTIFVFFAVVLHLYDRATRQPSKGKMQAVRYLPSHASPAQPFPVVIKVNSSFVKSTSFIMKEFLPPACTVSKGEPVFVVQNDVPVTIKWLSSTDEEEELYYAYLTQPDNSVKSGQELTFSGRLMVEGKTRQLRDIQGRNTVTIMNYHWADSNRDYIIDDNEILDIYSSFDILRDVGVDIEEIREIWANKGYRWDKGNGKFTVIRNSRPGSF
jgi:transcriptional regulator with XRE-family HTH domain